MSSTVFSRGVILFGGIFTVLAIILFRWVLVKTNIITLADEDLESRQTFIVASQNGFESIKKNDEGTGQGKSALLAVFHFKTMKRMPFVTYTN